MADPILIYLIAGESSGDDLGRSLMHALRAILGDRVAFAGIGGPGMIGQGLDPLFPMTDLSVMGLTEVIGHLPRLVRRLNKATADILRRKPDLLITIDAPDFCFRVARRIAKIEPAIKRVHYVAPSVWAWRPGRAAKIARIYHHLLALLPFEPPYFTRVGLPCTFVGHPAADVEPQGSAIGFRHRHEIAAGKPIVLLLPGSRMGEIDRLLPLFISVARALDPGRKISFAIITLPHLEAYVRRVVDASEVDCVIATRDLAKRDGFAAARAALAASGTVALELGLACVPSVICYRVSPLSALLAKRLIKVKFVSLINLILDKEVMPEFLQDNATAEKIVPALAKLLEESPERHSQILSDMDAAVLLKPPGGSSAETAARAALSVLGRVS